MVLRERERFERRSEGLGLEVRKLKVWQCGEEEER